MVECYEVWHWDKWEKYDPITKTGGLFTEYINRALKLKLEASGYPSYVKTDQEKEAYIERVHQREGILLDKDKIIKNPGKRSVAKLMLNSLWGYLAMLLNKTSYKLINKPAQWYSMVTDQRYKIKGVNFSVENMLQVSYSINDEFFTPNFKTNVAIAAFVTCQGRLKLYDQLERLDRRVLYFDTDSIIYISKEGYYEPPIGEFLGELTDEIDEKDGNFIDEFVSAGPKNYAYKTDKGVTKCTIKGFTLNYITSLKLNFDKIKEIVQTDQLEKVPVSEFRIVRDKKTWNVKSIFTEKNYAFVYTIIR